MTIIKCIIPQTKQFCKRNFTFFHFFKKLYILSIKKQHRRDASLRCLFFISNRFFCSLFSPALDLGDKKVKRCALWRGQREHALTPGYYLKAAVLDGKAVSRKADRSPLKCHPNILDLAIRDLKNFFFCSFHRDTTWSISSSLDLPTEPITKSTIPTGKSTNPRI